CSSSCRFCSPTAGGVQKWVVHLLRSSQLRAAPTQVPVMVQVSATVQTLPSVQAAPTLTLTKPQTPAPLHALLVQTVPAVQGEPSGSNWPGGGQRAPGSL